VLHAAIDLGATESQFCIREADGTIVEEKKVPTKKLESLFAIWPTSRVIVETSAEAFHIADAALAHKHQVRVVPATLVKTLGVGARGIKNDQRDARTLSEVSCRIDLPSVHIPSALSREWKSLCGCREALVEARTKLINNVRGWLRTRLWRVRTGRASTFCDRVRGHASSKTLELPAHIERQLTVLDALNEQVRAADKHVRDLAKANEVCRRLMTVPGVGPVTAVRFVAALDDIQRFSGAHSVESYVGLTPGERSSAERQQRTGITKAGSAALRKMLIQSAWSAFRTNAQEPMVAWARKLAERRNKFVAVTALARKITGILYAMWRDGTSYRSERSAAT